MPHWVPHWPGRGLCGCWAATAGMALPGAAPIAALVTIVVVGPVMLAAYLLLLKLFRATELQRPAAAAAGPPAAGRGGCGSPMTWAATGPGRPCRTPRTRPERATVSVDTGLIPRFRGNSTPRPSVPGPTLAGTGLNRAGRAGPEGGYLPAVGPSQHGVRAACGRGDIPLPGRRTYQGPAGHNPYFPPFRRQEEKIASGRVRSAMLPRPGHCIG